MAHSGKATVALPTDEQILITREFDAPRHLVYKAWTTPELVRRWWAGHRGEMRSVEIDLRVGGRLVAGRGGLVAGRGGFVAGKGLGGGVGVRGARWLHAVADGHSVASCGRTLASLAPEARPRPLKHQ